jgi:hypothetical protein
MNKASSSKTREEKSEPVSIGDQLRNGLLSNRRAILVLLWGVTGFLGLPVLWLSPKFSWPEKFIYSLLITIYSVFLIAFAGGIVWWAYLRIMG